MMGRILVIGRQAIRKAHTTFWQGFLVLRRRHLDVCVKSAPPNRRTWWAGGETRMRVSLAGFGGARQNAPATDVFSKHDCQAD